MNQFVTRILGCGFTAFAFLVSVGCHVSTQETPVASPIKLSGPTKDCFGESLRTFERFFKDQAAPVEIDNAYICVSGALELFVTHARGTTNRESYSPKELRAFLESQFLGSIKLNDVLLLEFMRVKQALLGGAADRLTKVEIANLVTVLESLRVETQRLRPYIGLISQNTDPRHVDAAFLEQALSDFAFSMGTLGTLLSNSQQPYKLENLKTLMVEFQKLYDGRSEWSGPAWLSKQTPLITATKSFLMAPKGDTIAPNEWRPLFSYVGRLYGLYLRYEYEIKGRDLFFGPALGQLQIAVHQISEVLDDAIQAKPSKKIDYKQLREFLSAIDKSKIVKLPVRASTISGLFEPFLERILNPANGPKSPTAAKATKTAKAGGKARRTGVKARVAQGGLTSGNLRRLTDTLQGWIEMQLLWEKLEREAARRSPSLAGKPIPIQMVRSIWATFSPQYIEPWSDLKSLFDRPLTPATYKDGRLMMVPSEAVVISRDSFASLNWKQQTVRTIGYGYLTDPKSQRMTGISLEQLKTVFLDFWVLTLDLKFLDSTDVEIWKTGFTIANIFLYSSDGNDRLSFHEAVDLFVFSFASSVISKERIRPDVLANCKKGEKDAAGIPRIQSACWRDRFQRGYPNFFSSIPGWKNLVANWNADAWDSFFDDIERASRKPTNPSGALMSSEMDRAVSIHHYIEALYTRWDSDQNGHLSMEEADRAYPLFCKILKDASGFKKDGEVRALFFYLLTFGEPPQSWSNKIYWLWWKGQPEEWAKRVNADRTLLAQIFGNLASSL